MKRTLRPCTFIAQIAPALFAGLLILALTPGSGKCLDQRPYPVKSGDSILIQKQIISKKHRISLYPNADQQVLFFGVKGDEGKVYQLFLFDVEGTLVKRSEVRNRQTTIIKDIEKGTYLFDVFSDDERIENGQIIVR